jgi:outer membrane protein X
MKSFFFSLFMFIVFSASGQTYKPFKVNVSLGYAQPLLPGISGGGLFALEPKYGINDHIDLGVRLEGALVARGVTVNGATSTGEVNYLGSYLLTGNYIFGKAKARPFIGLGGGLYRITSSGVIEITDGQSWEEVTLTADNKWGALLRAGIKAGHFLVSVEYNAVPASVANLGNTSLRSRNDYLGIKLGVDIGGGKLRAE